MAALLLLLATPFLLLLGGFVLLINKDEAKRKNGKRILLAGLILLGLEILIGYSICSNMSFGGLH